MQSLSSLQQTYQSVASSSLPLHMKKLILTSVVYELKLLASNVPKMTPKSRFKSELDGTSSTSRSHLSVLSIQHHSTPFQGMEELIVEKQKEKVWLDEEIELMEEDSFECEKVIFIKRDLCQQL